MKEKRKNFLQKYKYELLLFGLSQHIFISMFMPDLALYRKFVWPINMLVLGFTSFGIFIEKNKIRLFILRFLVFVICSTPVLSYFMGFSDKMMIFLSVSYTLFFAYVFYEIMIFLIKPSYINRDIISAAGVGYLLLIEIATFAQQTIFYFNKEAYSGLDLSHPTATFVDFVYFSTITLTSIGFGDILPNTHYTKLLTSLIGIVGQFYSVVLVGILISKFTNGGIVRKK
ncbi:MAG: ion channel [Chitinophagales bacterium]|nr:ion channel [Chitinophagales bacterium]